MSLADRKTAVELVSAGVLSGVLHALLPLSADDPFRTTLLTLPLVVAGLRAIGHLALAESRRASDMSTIRDPAAFLEGALLLVWLILVLVRDRLGLLEVDNYLAAGGVLLLTLRVGRLLVFLRPCLGRRLPRRPSVAFFFLPLVVYLALQPWMAEHRLPDGDEPYYLLIAHSLSHDFDTDLANNYAAQDAHLFLDRDLAPQPGDPSGPNGAMYSRHNMLLPLLLALPYRLGGLWGAMATMAVFAAALAWMVLRLAHFYAPSQPTGGLLAYALFAFSPPLLLYSHQIWVEVPAALLLTLVLDRGLALRHRPWRAADVFIFAVPLTLLPLLKLRFALVALSLLGLTGWRSRLGRRALLGLFGGLALVAVAILALNQLRFGHPLKMHRLSELALGGHAPGEFLRGAVGTFYDSAFGLFAYAPVWLLLVPGLVVAVRKRAPYLVDLAVVALPYSLVFWPRIEWFGGWSPPFRYPLVYLPLLALVLIPLFERRGRGLKVWGGALAILTLVLTLFWVVLPPWTYNLADGGSDLLDHLGQRFGADVARFFPSAVRPRDATWWWPAASLLLIPLVLASSRRRSPSGALWSGVVVLTLAAALPLLSTRVPTRVVEVEDAHHSGRGIMLYPRAWEVARARYTNGRLVKPGGYVEATVIPGGDRVHLRFVAQTPGSPGTLEILAGDRLLARQDVTADDWKEFDLGVFPWTAGRPLVLRSPEDPTKTQNGVLVDRVELEWQR